MDNGTITINDNLNNQYKSDIYGRKPPKFLPNITGLYNRYINNYRINNISTNNTPNIFRKNKLSNLKTSSYNLSLENNSLEKNSKNFDKRNGNYTPVIRKFEGYSKFPRPKGPPLLNIPNYEIKEKNKRKIIDNLSNYFPRIFLLKMKS